MRWFIAAAFVFSIPFFTSAQVSNSALFTRNPSPVYILSSDGKTLGIHEIAENEQRWCNFIDVASFKTYPMASVSMKHTFITPDLKSAYSSEVNLKGFKGNVAWQAYEKYISWYYPSSTSMNRNQWPDKNFVVAPRSDGKILTAGELKFKTEKNKVIPTVTMSDLNVTDPLTGNVVTSLRKGKIMTIPYEWWNTRPPQLINSDNLLVWSDVSWGLVWNSLKIKDGEPVSFYVPDQIEALSGRFGMGVKRVTNTAGKVLHRKFIVNMETGVVVQDDTLSTKDAQGFWCAAGLANANAFYTLNGFTSELRKEEWDGKKFRVTKTVKLNVTDLIAVGHWGATDKSGYQLLISESTGQALMVPVSITAGNMVISNALLAWRLSDGQLIYQNPDFIQPLLSSNK
jgi:hypothetical protein